MGKEITELKKAKEEISRLSSYPEINPNPIFEIDNMGNLIYWNSAAKKLHEKGICSLKEFIAGIVDLFHDKKKTAISREIKIGDNWYLQNMHVVPDSGNIRVYCADITKRIIAEKRVKDALLEWQNTFDAISDLIFIQNYDHVILKVNKSFAEALKLKPAEIVGKKCYELLHKSNVPWPDCPFEKTKKDKKPGMSEVDDPNIGIPLLITTSPLFDDKGKLTGAVHIARDISYIKEGEKQLKRKMHDLEIFQKAAVDRELKMIELKKRIKELEERNAD